MWDPKLNRFARNCALSGDGTVTRDMTIDASLYAIAYFHALPVNDPRVESTMRAVRDRLYVQTPVGGLARYENDYYHQVSKDVEKVAGNPWFICTLWLAQYEIARAKSVAELESKALPLLRWVVDRALPSGALAEQVNPYTGEPISVSPLTWSHATFVSATHEYINKRRELKGK
jgi:GH15 family glucan-1,4-alpha-glucosidase